MVSTDRIDGVQASVALKAPVRVASTANVTLSGTQTIDGVAVVVDDRVLLKDQTDGTENGIYDVSATAWTRAKDWDGARDIVSGTRVFINLGSAGAGKQAVITTTGALTIGTTSLAFSLLTSVDATIAADLAALEPIKANITTVAGISANVTTVAGISANVTTVTGIAANVTTVAGIAANVSTVAADSDDIATVAADGSDIGVVSGISANVTTVAGIAANVTTVAGVAANVTTVAGIAANVTTVAGNSANVTTVAGISANVTTVAGIAANVSAVAAMATGWNFDSATTMADPGNGDLRMNNGTVSSVTAIAVDDLDAGGTDRSAFVVTWDDSSSTNKGTLIITDGTSGAWAIFSVTGLTDNSGWTQLAVTYVATAGSFSNADKLYVTFTRTGDVLESASTTVSGKVELATTVETTTGTDTGRAVTPDGLHDMTSLSGAAWMLDENDMSTDSAIKVASQQSIKAYVDALGVTSSGSPTFTGLTTTGHTQRSLATSLTAGTTQTMAGALALTKDINIVTAVGSDDDGVALPTAVAGKEVTIINSDAAQRLQIWPGNGFSDTIDGGSANAVDPNKLAAGGVVRTYVADGSTNWVTSVAAAPAASATVAGVIELATDAEGITGSATDRAITPANLQAKVAGAAALGIVELATDAETITGTDTARAVTPANIQAKVAGLTAKGIVELATEAEHVTGTDEARASTVLGTASVVQDGKWTYVAGAGSADVQTITLVPAVGAYVAGQRFQFLPTADNTGACTLNVNGLGAKNILKSDGAGALENPAAADLDTVLVADVIYDGTQFVLQNPAVAAAGGNSFTGDVTITSGNLVIGTAGKGIDFTAVADNAGMDGELFDKYERGTYLATIVGGTSGDYSFHGSGTYARLSYRVLGDLCHISGMVIPSGDNSIAGILKMSLPFTSLANEGSSYTNDTYHPIHIHVHGDGGMENAFIEIGAGQTVGHLYNLTDAGAFEEIDEARVDASFYMSVNLFFRIA